MVVSQAEQHAGQDRSRVIGGGSKCNLIDCLAQYVAGKDRDGLALVEGRQIGEFFGADAVDIVFVAGTGQFDAL